MLTNIVHKSSFVHSFPSINLCRSLMLEKSPAKPKTLDGKTQLDHFNSFFLKNQTTYTWIEIHILPTIRKYIVFGFAWDFSSINDWQSNITPNLVSYHLLVSQKTIILSTIIYLLKPKKRIEEIKLELGLWENSSVKSKTMALCDEINLKSAFQG